MNLHRNGVSRRKIACQLGIHRSTVARYIASHGFPERATRSFRSKTDGFQDYLWQRWSEGCHNAKELTDELRHRGFTGSYSSVRRRIAAWRCEEPAKHERRNTQSKTRISAQRISWLFITNREKVTDQEQSLMRRLKESCPDILSATNIADDFLTMIRTKTPGSLRDWIETATSSAVPAEMRRFAKGIARDREAVIAGIEGIWSNSQTERQVNRLKLIKRQMYGRGNFDLLRKRVLSRVA